MRHFLRFAFAGWPGLPPHPSHLVDWESGIGVDPAGLRAINQTALLTVGCLVVAQPEETTAETTKEEASTEAETAAAEEPAEEPAAEEEAEAEEEEEEEEEEPVDPKEQLEEGGFNPDAVTDSVYTAAAPGRRDPIAVEEDEILRAASSLCAMARAG
jgi:hypothetical protein